MRVQWALEHENKIKRNFNKEARMAGESPKWIPNYVWTPLLEHWNSSDYHNKCSAAKKK